MAVRDTPGIIELDASTINTVYLLLYLVQQLVVLHESENPPSAACPRLSPTSHERNCYDTTISTIFLLVYHIDHIVGTTRPDTWYARRAYSTVHTIVHTINITINTCINIIPGNTYCMSGIHQAKEHEHSFNCRGRMNRLLGPSLYVQGICRTALWFGNRGAIVPWR